jgi:hypothetical protein
MDKKEFIEKLYRIITEDYVQNCKNSFNNTNISSSTIPYWKESLKFYTNLPEENKKIFFNVIKQVGIDSTACLLAILDGITCLEGQDSDFILKFKNTDEIINGDLSDLFLEHAEIMGKQGNSSNK